MRNALLLLIALINFSAAITIPLKYASSNFGIRTNWEIRRKKLVAVSGSRDFSYFADINIGGQPFSIALDTGSSDLWVGSAACNDSECVGVPQYRPSTTFSNSSSRLNIHYLTGFVSGFIGTETIRFAQYEISSQVFALADHLTDLGFSQMGISGMLGLGFPSIASISSNRGLPVAFNIFASLPEPERFFALRLGREVLNTVGPSSFSIGTHDSIVSDPAALHYIPVYPKNIDRNDYDYWKIPLDAIIVNNRSLQLSASRVRNSRYPICIFDSGTSLMVGPTADVDEFYSSLSVGNGSKDSTGQWSIDCSLAIDLIVILAGRAFPIHPLDVSWDKITDGFGRCLGGLQGNDKVISGDWLFGDTVMRNIYVAHYAETIKSPPILGLLPLSKPSENLQEFVRARGPLFQIATAALFSDDVLHISYTFETPNSTPRHGLETQSIDTTLPQSSASSLADKDAPLDYYSSSKGTGLKQNLLILILATSLGFISGSALVILMKRCDRGFGYSFGEGRMASRFHTGRLRLGYKRGPRGLEEETVPSLGRSANRTTMLESRRPSSRFRNDQEI